MAGKADLGGRGGGFKACRPGGRGGGFKLGPGPLALNPASGSPTPMVMPGPVCSACVPPPFLHPEASLLIGCCEAHGLLGEQLPPGSFRAVKGRRSGGLLPGLFHLSPVVPLCS